MPIYYVIAEDKPSPVTFYSIWHIIKVYECDLADIHQYDIEVSDLFNLGRHIQTFIFYREPENPFRVGGKSNG